MNNKNYMQRMKQINESAGNQFVVREKLKSISLNIFLNNSEQLLETLEYACDSEYGLQLVGSQNNAQGSYIHAEINRHVHNFVSSSMTLVEHTRNLMRKFYENTELFTQYQNKINSDFKSDGCSAFIQGLRNYILHCGLPQTSLGFSINNLDGNFISESTVFFNTKALLEWEKWTKNGKIFLQNSEDQLHIKNVVNEYRAKIISFHEWLDGLLRDFHMHDLVKMNEFINEYNDTTNRSHSFNLNNSQLKQVDASNTNNTLAEISDELIAGIKEIQLKQNNNNNNMQSNWSSRPRITITDEQMIKTPIYTTTDIEGIPVHIFILHEGITKGINDSILNNVTKKLYKFLNNETIAISSLQRCILEWCQNHSCDLYTEDFSSFLNKKIEQLIVEKKVFFPIANIEIEKEIVLTEQIRLMPLTEKCIDDWFGHYVGDERPNKLKAKIKNDMQGLASIVFLTRDDTDLSIENAIPIAKDIVSFLRFFFINHPKLETSTINLFGQESLPISNIIVKSSENFQYTSQLLSHPNTLYLSSDRLKENKSQQFLEMIRSLIYSYELTPFEQTLKQSILIYSAGMLTSDLTDKLSYICRSLENLLLKHEMEYKYASLSKRIPLLCSQEQRNIVSEVIKKAYHMQNNGLSTSINNNMDVLSDFATIAYDILLSVAIQAKHFSTKIDFIDYIQLDEYH